MGHDFGNDWLKTNYAGSGPFKIREWRANEVVVLERNDNYYGDEADAGARDLPPHEGERHPAPAAREGRHRHRPQPVDPHDLDAVAKQCRHRDHRARPRARSTTSRLNQKNPNLAKPEVREAMKYLVDYDAIGDTLIKGIGAVHQTFLPIGLLGAIDDNPYKLDVAKAKELLAKAGLPDGFTVTMDMRNTQPVHRHRRGLPADRQARPASRSRSSPATASRR